MRKPLVIALVVAVLAAAAVGYLYWLGKRTVDEPAPPPPGKAEVTGPPAVPADAAAPFSYANKTESAEISLKLPAELGREPDLHARLYSDGVQGLKTFAEGAAAERAELQGEGSAIPAYIREITWSTSADTPSLLSLRQEVTEYAGGAHSNASYDALLWDKALKKTVPPKSLFRPGADLAPVDQALCKALTEAKQARLKADFQPQGDAWKCPALADTPFVLAASTQAGKVGGLTVLLAPYAVGAYAEGPYEITLPASDFQNLIATAYVDQFAGAPPKVGDTTNLQ